MNQVLPDHVTCTNTGAWIFVPTKGEQALLLVNKLLAVLANASELPPAVVEAVQEIRRSA